MKATFKIIAFWVGRENLKCLDQIRDHPFVAEQPDFTLPSQSKNELKQNCGGAWTSSSGFCGNEIRIVSLLHEV